MYAREPADLIRHRKRQARLLTNAGRLVRPGGRLVYAVCSFEPEETDAVVRAFLSAHPRYVVLPPDLERRPHWAPLVDATGGLRMLPHRHDMDGFFAICFQHQP